MRIISGEKKGRVLKVPNLSGGRRIRPLSEQAKEALFNILINKTADSYFLDLFAGSGQIGIEALSRGAKLSIFVEKDRNAVKVIRQNIESCGYSDRSEVFALDVIAAIAVLDKNGATFDLIFIGAPYGLPVLDETLEKISKTVILRDNGTVIAEHSKRHVIPEAFGQLKKFRENIYGDTVFSFYRTEKAKE